MLNFKKLVVFDYETDGLDTDVCSAVQLAAVVIDPRSLELIPGAEFNAFMKPNFDTVQQSTLEFHAKRLKKTPDEVLDLWKTYPDPKVVWPEFTKFLKQYHTRQDRQSKHSAPIPVGANIIKFDIPICKRYEKLYGEDRDLWSPRDIIDLTHWFFPWFESNPDVENLSMDTIREYLGMSNENAHDALQDVRDCAEIVIRFMRLIRATAAKTKFKGAFNAVQ